MRRVLQILFLLFYVASTYAIGQERTSLIVSELQHSGSREGQSQVGDGCRQLDPSRPIYRQAKPRTICAFEVGRGLNVRFLPHVSGRAIPLQLHSLKSLCSIERILDRAPPSQS